MVPSDLEWISLQLDQRKTRFKDEPAERVEVQQRTFNLKREASLSSLADSLSGEDFTHVGARGNAFRDEISRQRAGR
jgi:hypothetical protein